MLKPGTLWDRTVRTTRSARESQSLTTFETQLELFEDGGIQFALRCLPGLIEEKRASVFNPDSRPGNPFLPYDPQLFVANLSKTHLCLLNKFNVVDHHLLIVTRRFEDQESPLTAADFESTAVCLREFEGLAFYNSGRVAGASQPHKHIQYVPPRLNPDQPQVPIETLLHTGSAADSIRTCDRLPFRHAHIGFPAVNLSDTEKTGQYLLDCYQTLTKELALENRPYNLLLTRRWMLMVLRSRDRFESISVNALGYAGSLLARNRSEVRRIKQVGPMTLLQHCGV